MKAKAKASTQMKTTMMRRTMAVMLKMMTILMVVIAIVVSIEIARKAATLHRNFIATMVKVNVVVSFHRKSEKLVDLGSTLKPKLMRPFQNI